MSYSIEEVEKHMAEMVDWQVGEDIEENKAKKEVWTMMDEWKSTRLEKVHSCWDGNKSKMHLLRHTGMVEIPMDSFNL